MRVKPMNKLPFFMGLSTFVVSGGLLVGTGFTSHHKPQIAFTSGRDGNDEIYVMDADGRNQTRLTHDMAINGAPAWSPDGSMIVFESSLDEDTIIVVMNADGTNPRNLTEEVLNGVWERNSGPAWSPDGETIAYISNIPGRNDSAIHLMTVNGEHFKRLGKEGDYSPDWFASAALAVSPASKQHTIWGRLKQLAFKAQ